MFRITNADIKWGIKIFSLGIASGVLALILSSIYPHYWAAIVYTACGFIIYLMILTVRKIEWKK
jgi:hypothetical protein